MTLIELKNIAPSVCREFDVGRLDVFGSTVRGSSRETRDVDLLVEFKDPARFPARRFFGLLHRFEDTLGCRVDLLTLNGLRNPYFKRRVMKEKVSIYEG